MKYKLLILICIVTTAISCNKNPYIKDVESIKVDFTIQPFYKDILKSSEKYSKQQQAQLHAKYGSFYESFNTRIFKLGVLTDTGYQKRLYDLLHEDWILELYKTTNKTFADTTIMYEKLHNAFQYYKYYFPKKQIPNMCSFIGGVQYSIVIDSGMVAIGLDKYLGSDYPMYADMQISTFIKRNMYAEKIPTDVMRAITESEFPNALTEEYLLSKMIQQGRYMYFVKCMFPEESDSIIWGYTGKQLEFCKKSESEFWKYFVSTENMLFSGDYMLIKRFVDDGPFTPVFTKDSPGKIGQWIGFKIVESFMKNNPNVSLEDLFSIQSSQEIMRRAKYNP